VNRAALDPDNSFDNKQFNRVVVVVAAAAAAVDVMHKGYLPLALAHTFT
jgi:hypothetical protein